MFWDWVPITGLLDNHNTVDPSKAWFLEIKSGRAVVELGCPNSSGELFSSGELDAQTALESSPPTPLQHLPMEENSPGQWPLSHLISCSLQNLARCNGCCCIAGGHLAISLCDSAEPSGSHKASQCLVACQGWVAKSGLAMKLPVGFGATPYQGHFSLGETPPLRVTPVQQEGCVWIPTAMSQCSKKKKTVQKKSTKKIWLQVLPDWMLRNTPSP